MEHWLSLGVGIFLLAMVLYGHYRGFLRIAVALFSLVLSMVVVRVAMPYVNTYLRENTAIHSMVEESLIKAAGIEESEDGETAQLPAQQRMMIERMRLPEQMKQALIENNNSEIYHILGVDTFLHYVGTYLANMVLNLVGSILLLGVVYLLIRLLVRWLDLIARLPVLYGINQIAGALLGGAQGLLWIWGLFLLVDVCSETFWAAAMAVQIQKSVWLKFLYDNNLFNWIFVSILRAMI